MPRLRLKQSSAVQRQLYGRLGANACRWLYHYSRPDKSRTTRTITTIVPRPPSDRGSAIATGTTVGRPNDADCTPRSATSASKSEYARPGYYQNCGKEFSVPNLPGCAGTVAVELTRLSGAPFVERVVTLERRVKGAVDAHQDGTGWTYGRQKNNPPKRAGWQLLKAIFSSGLL